MEYKTIDEVYEANRAIREKLKETLGSLSDEKINMRPDNDRWSIAQLVEHISIVNEGMAKICAKLLSKAEASGRTSDGRVTISADFTLQATASIEQKLQAPEMVRPGDSPSVAASLDRLAASEALFDDLRVKFESVDGTDPKFPHPYFGDLSAQEWLVLAGGHEARHLRQIRRLAAELE